MKFFDVRSSIKIPDLPAESFDRKLMGAFNHYNIHSDRTTPGEKIIFSIPYFRFFSLKYRKFIFYGVSSGEIDFFNQGGSLIVRFKLTLLPIRIATLAFVLLMITTSIFQNHYVPLIMAGWMCIIYFVAINAARHKFGRWFSRFTK